MVNGTISMSDYIIQVNHEVVIRVYFPELAVYYVKMFIRKVVRYLNIMLLEREREREREGDKERKREREKSRLVKIKNIKKQNLLYGCFKNNPHKR